MNWGIIIFIGVVGCVLLVWYLYQRSQNDAADNTEEPTDNNADDGYEDLLLTGLMLEEIYDDDNDSSDDMDSDGHDGFDGGYDDGGTLE